MLLSFGGAAPLQAAAWPEAHTAAIKPIAWQITGKVTTADGEPLPGVTVLVKGTTVGAATGVDGGYSLSVPETGGTLVFSFIGYTTVEKSFSGPGTVNVTMAADAKALEEVVVTGYTTQTRKDITGAVSVVKTEELLATPPATCSSRCRAAWPG